MMLFLEIFALYIARSAVLADYRSPSFLIEPLSLSEFSNVSGTVIPCSVSGHPVPAVSWILRGGGLAKDIPALRQTRHDGSLLFPPFPAEEYRADVHAAIYKCVATNIVGSIASRDVRVRAVVLQRYEIRLFDEFVVKGNMAVLRCPIPSFVSDYVFVTSWERNDGFTITPDKMSGKYGMLDNGDLYLRDSNAYDNSHSFRCHTENRVTKERRASTNFSKVIVTEPHHSQPPRFIRRSGSKVTVLAGHRATLSCAAQGHPVPMYRWHKKTSERQGMREVGTSARQEEGVLVFTAARLSDSGSYSCVVSNTVGQEKVETELLVEEHLRISLVPKEVRLEIGESVVFNCSVSGSATNNIVWNKDTRLIPSDGGRISFPTPNILQIRRIQRKDAGIYQCFASTEHDSAQGSARIIIGDIAPELKKTFPEKTIRAGTYVSLTCVSSGNPMPQMKWTLDGIWSLTSRPNLLIGTYLSDSGEVISFLNISSADVRDGGLYACEAVNEAGSQLHSNRLNVMGPLMVRTLNNVTALAGDTFKLMCPFGGYPFQDVRWRKEGRLLPAHQRQSVFPNGTLLIEDVESDTDDGYYSCEVHSAQQAPASGTFRISVRTRPKVAPFFFQENLHQGMRTAVTCIVSAGDPPFTIKWMKDGRTLNDGVLDARIIDDGDGFVSTLTINKLAYRHNGNYTCLASNDVATGSYSVNLTVKVPPRWVLEPKDGAATAGRAVMVDCQAEGVPEPHIRWKISTGRQPPEQFKTIVSSSNVHILANGSLNFRSVESTDAGQYLCEANNGVGSGLSVVVKLTVHSAPTFHAKFQAISMRRGERKSLECDAKGDQPMVVTWRKNGAVLDLATEPRYSQTVEEFQNVKKVQLMIGKANKKDTSLFTCTAVNEFGEDFTNIQVTVQDIPEAPQNLEVHDVTSRTVRLTWNRPFDGNSPITSYTVAWRLLQGEMSDDGSGGPSTVSGSDTTVTVRNLTPIKRYFFRVKCENALGESQYSAESAVTTLDEPPRKQPTSVKAFAKSSTSVNVTWRGAMKESGMGSVEGYYVGYRMKASSQPYIFKPGMVLSPSDQSLMYHIIDELERHTDYTVVVQAFNSRGAGPPSDESYIRTLEFDPPGVPVIKTFSATSKTIHLTWHLMISPFAPVSGYILHHRTESESWHETHLNGDRSSYTLRDLQCGTTYLCFLLAYNSAGRSNGSDVVTTKTDGNAPIAPDKRILLAVNSSSVIVHLNSWYNGGCPITNFVIQYKISGQKEWTLVSNNIIPQQNNVTVASLMPGTWYSLLMTAKNDAGTTDAEYVFATLTPNGEFPPPPSEISDSGDSLYRHLTITVPVLSSGLVLVVVLFVVCFVTRRRTVSGCRPSGPEGSETIDTTKREQLPLSVTYDNSQEPAYFPAPYATSRVSGYSSKQQHCMQTDDHRDMGTFGSRRSGYSYDIPCSQRRHEKSEEMYDPPVVYFTSYPHAGMELRTQAIYEVPDRGRFTAVSQHDSRSWREAGDGNSSTESDNDELLYTLCTTNESMIKEEARESETECDRLWKTFEGSQYEGITR